MWELPWSRNERDEAKLRRDCVEILEELASDITEVEAKEALEPIVSDISEEIKERQARKQRNQQKVSLIQRGVAEVSSYLLTLKTEGEITSEEYWDSGLTAELKEIVRKKLESELSGEETSKEVQTMVCETIDEELEL